MFNNEYNDFYSFEYDYDPPEDHPNNDKFPFYSENPDNNEFNSELNDLNDDSHYFNINSEKDNKQNSEITAPTSPNTQKIQDNKEENNKIIDNTNKKNKVENIIDNKDNDELITKKKGRRANNDNRAVLHTKYKQDNMMRKIKTHFMSYLIELLNKSLQFTYRSFKKITTKVHENLNIDFNIELMNMTIKQIYEKYPLNKRYNQTKKGNPNYLLIQQIFENDKEKKTIRILNSKYIEILDEFRTNYLKKFNEDLKSENDEKYIEKINALLFQYEDWFETKKKKKPKNKNEK